MQFKISSDLKNIAEVSEKVLQCLKGAELSDSFLFDIKLASEEAVINAIKHGNQCAADKTVSINCELTNGAVVITIADQGTGFDYHNPPDPTTEENLIKGSGRGLFLIRNTMDKVEYNAQGNRISMTKFLPNKGG